MGNDFLKTVLFTLSLGSSCLVLAFTFSSNDPLQQGWAGRPVRFFINRANCPANIDSLLAQSIALWNSVPESALKVEIGDDSTQTAENIMAETATEVPLIACSTTFETTVGSGVDADSIPGVGLIYGSTFRPITGGGLILNVQPGGAANMNVLNATTAAVVVAHEIGHVLGIGHSADTAALMYYDASAKGTLNLAQDDIDAVTFLYPRNELSNIDLIGGCGLIAQAIARGGQGPWGGNSLFLFTSFYLLFVALRKLPLRFKRFGRS